MLSLLRRHYERLSAASTDAAPHPAHKCTTSRGGGGGSRCSDPKAAHQAASYLQALHHTHCGRSRHRGCSESKTMESPQLRGCQVLIRSWGGLR